MFAVGWGSPFRRTVDLLGINSNSMQKFGTMEEGNNVMEDSIDTRAVNKPLPEEELEERTQLDDYLDEAIRCMTKRQERLQLRRPRS